MKIRNIIRLSLVSLAITATTSSCNDWLQVDMEDSIMENLLFENDEGYISALNGIYTKMNEQYGNTLTMGTIDVMAQYYDVAKNDNHSQSTYAKLQYTQSTFRSLSNSLWTALYGYIANINTLLDHCDATDSKLSKHYYPYVKGEALALRAFFHFDMLRLYGPIYSADTENTIVMPYEETTSKQIQPLLSAKEVASKILRDLDEAANLLKNDRIRTDGAMLGDSEDINEKNTLRYRQFRLNYYAIQALKARVYLWIGDKENAYNTAMEIIKENKEKEVFPWIKKDAVTGTTNPDRVFSPEVMFSLYNQSRKSYQESLFSSRGDINSMLYFKGTSLEDGDIFSKLTYFYDDFGDLRRSTQWTVAEITANSEEGSTKKQQVLAFNKYMDSSSDTPSRYMIPLIRMSEVYLIAAECAKTTQESISYINDIRAARNCVKLELKDTDGAEEIQNYIYREFMREEIGEGQMFFYYKRKAMKEMMSGTEFGQEAGWWTPEGPMEGVYKVELSQYVWPMPEVESNKRLKK